MALLRLVLTFCLCCSFVVYCQPTSPAEMPGLPGTCDSLTTTQEFLLQNAAKAIQKHNCVNRGNYGSWTRVAYLNMRNTSHSCPTNWRTVSTPIRACRRRSSFVCNSAYFYTGNSSYTQISGKIIGYQYGSPEGFANYISRNVGIEDHYLDGVSVTYDESGSRRHIWSFVAGNHESSSATSTSGCPCNFLNWPHENPPFVGMDYFCESGSYNRPSSVLYDEDPLWDGSGCRGNNLCCHFNQPPWFCKTLSESTTSFLEVRICADNDIFDEDIFVTEIELFIR